MNMMCTCCERTVLSEGAQLLKFLTLLIRDENERGQGPGSKNVQSSGSSSLSTKSRPLPMRPVNSVCAELMPVSMMYTCAPLPVPLQKAVSKYLFRKETS